jgi:hypothetical protein
MHSANDLNESNKRLALSFAYKNFQQTIKSTFFNGHHGLLAHLGLGVIGH